MYLCQFVKKIKMITTMFFFYLLASSKSSSQERRFSKLRSPGGENIREVVECSHSAKNQQRDLENIEETRDPRMPFIKLKEESFRNIFISNRGI